MYHRFLDGTFVGDEPPTILSDEQALKEIECEGAKVNINLLESTGREEYNAMMHQHVRLIEGKSAILCLTFLLASKDSIWRSVCHLCGCYEPQGL